VSYEIPIYDRMLVVMSAPPPLTRRGKGREKPCLAGGPASGFHRCSADGGVAEATRQ
jgi:hypothetical protein